MSTERTRSINRFERWRRMFNTDGAERTAKLYADAMRRLDEWLDATGDPRELTALGTDDLDEFLDDFARGNPQVAGFERSHAPNYVNQVYRGLLNFYAWAVGEYGLPVNPMNRVISRRASDISTKDKILSDAQLAAVLDVVAHERREFSKIRDHAMLRLLLNGPRNSEIVGMRVDDVDLDAMTARVRGKGKGRGKIEREIRFGDATALALDRYLEHRARHRLANLPALWIGQHGAITTRGFHKNVARRGRQAGIDGLHPHMFRHTHAHRWLAAGGSESDLMENNGWASSQMPRHYAKQLAGKRAQATARKLKLDSV